MTVLSEPFVDMARKIDLNAENGFGGAFVVQPPGEDAQPVVLLMLDNSADPAMFWSNVQTMAAMALKDLEDRSRDAAGFRMR